MSDGMASRVSPQLYMTRLVLERRAAPFYFHGRRSVVSSGGDAASSHHFSLTKLHSYIFKHVVITDLMPTLGIHFTWLSLYRHGDYAALVTVMNDYLFLLRLLFFILFHVRERRIEDDQAGS